MASVADVCEVLERTAPSQLAEEWDNVGLLVGDPSREVTRLMTCLTITPSSATEAVEKQVQMTQQHPHPQQEQRRRSPQQQPQQQPQSYYQLEPAGGMGGGGSAEM